MSKTRKFILIGALTPSLVLGPWADAQAESLPKGWTQAQAPAEVGPGNVPPGQKRELPPHAPLHPTSPAGPQGSGAHPSGGHAPPAHAQPPVGAASPHVAPQDSAHPAVRHVPPAPAVTPPPAAHAQPPVGVAPPTPAAGYSPAQPAASQRSGSHIGPATAAAIGATAGLVGGFMLGHETRSIGDVRTNRREFNQDGVTVIQEPGRTIVREDDRVFIRHDENDRFRDLGGDMRSERRGNEIVTIYRRPDGDEIVTVTDENGYLLRRIRRDRDGREVVIIDNSFRGPPRSFDDEVVVLPPPPIEIPRERYVVDAAGADESVIHEALFALPLSRLPRRYTLDEVRNSPSLRAYTRSVDLDTINFDSGSWALSQDQGQRLAGIAGALNEAIRRNPSEVFLIEGHTDAVGSDVDNLSLSDRRAQAAAATLTRDFSVPPENLTTQGYGAQYLKVQTLEASGINRRVTIRRITPLLTGQSKAQ